MDNQGKGKSVRFGLMLGATVLPVLLILNYLGRVELAYPVLASIIAIGFAIRGYWELRGQLWFWITISVFLVVHGVLIFCIPWRSGWVPAPVIMVFCIVDFAIILGVVGVIEKWKSRNGEKQLGQDTKY